MDRLRPYGTAPAVAARLSLPATKTSPSGFSDIWELVGRWRCFLNFGEARSQGRRPATGSKTAIVLDLLRRKDGATLAEIAKATEWQNHSIRGFISGQVTKKMGLKVESTKSEAGERTYRIP